MKHLGEVRVMEDYMQKMFGRIKWIKCKKCGESYGERGIKDEICFNCQPKKFKIIKRGKKK